MKKRVQPSTILEYGFTGIVILLVIWVFTQVKNQDINFARKVLDGLAKGKPSVETFIDWEKLTVMDIKIGEAYLKLPNDKEKGEYRKEFVKNFAVGFVQGGGRLKYFTNWRIHSRDGSRVTIATDHLLNKNTLLMIINKMHGNKLTSFNLLKK